MGSATWVCISCAVAPGQIAETLVGEESGSALHDHQEQAQGRMAHRPVREIAALHVTLQLRNLFAFPPSLPATNAKRLRKGAKRRSNPHFLVATWIASLRSQ